MHKKMLASGLAKPCECGGLPVETGIFFGVINIATKLEEFCGHIVVAPTAVSTRLPCTS